MTDILLVEITFNQKRWYLSEEGYMGESYYSPFLEESPSLELGEVKGGYIGVRLGNLSISNRPNDRFSPFSIFGGGYEKLLSNPSQKIPVLLSWQQKDATESIFDGNMYLSSFDVDKFTFLLEDKTKDVDLLETAVDIKSNHVSVASISIRNLNVGSSLADAKAEVSAPAHGLVTGDLIRVSGATAHTEFNTTDDSGNIEDREVTVLNVNAFTYPVGSASNNFLYSDQYSLQTFTKKPKPFAFGVVDREKDIIQTAERNRTTTIDEVLSGFEYDNPDLDPSANAEDSQGEARPLQLYDDGVLVGDVRDTRGGDLAGAGVGVSGITANIDGIFTVTTSAAHGLEVGSTVSLEGVTDPTELNTRNAFYVVHRVKDTPASGGNPAVYSFDIFARLNPPHTGAITLSSAKIKTPGEFFGIRRVPNADTIFSRAFFNNLTVDTTASGYDASDKSTWSYNSSIASTFQVASGTTFTAKDGTVIYGTPLVSGISVHGETVAQFFSFIRKKIADIELGEPNIKSVDFSSAPNASSTRLSLWQTTQTKVLEYAGEIAYAANYLFEIRNNTIRVIDRDFESPNFININNWEIVKASYKMPTPTKALRVKWSSNIANPKTIPTSLTTREESVMISNMDSGEILDITYVTKDSADARSILEKIRKVLNKTVVTLSIGNIRTDIKVGTRIKANREEDGLSIDFIARTIKFNFKGLETEVVGEGTVRVIEQDSVY